MKAGTDDRLRQSLSGMLHAPLAVFALLACSNRLDDLTMPASASTPASAGAGGSSSGRDLPPVGGANDGGALLDAGSVTMSDDAGSNDAGLDGSVPADAGAGPTLLAHWNFEGGIADVQGGLEGTFNGSISSAPQTGAWGGAIELEDALSLISVDAFAPTFRELREESFSVFVRFRFPSATGQRVLLGQESPEPATIAEWALLINEGALQLITGPTSVATEARVTLDALLADDVWHELAFVFAAGSYEYYVAGSYRGAGNYPLVAAQSQQFSIGGLRGFALGLNGELDDLRIWRGRLSEQQISAIGEVP